MDRNLKALVGIKNAINEVRRQYISRGGRVIKPVHEYKKGSKFQLENRFWDSVFGKRDYLGVGWETGNQRTNKR